MVTQKMKNYSNNIVPFYTVYADLCDDNRRLRILGLDLFSETGLC